MRIKENIVSIIKSVVKNGLEKIGINDEDIIYEIPPSKEMGNLAFPMFKYSKTLKKSPMQVAEDLKKSIGENEYIFKIEVKGPYLNIFYSPEVMALKLLPEIIKNDHNFGKGEKKNKNVLLEFSCPNTNKPLHLGHCRNNALGDSMAKILQFNGYDVVKLNLINDRGVHICKSMLAYELFGNNTTPEKENKKSDHFVGDFYVAFAKESEKNPDLEKEAQAMLLKWEEGDKEVKDLWEKMNKWAIDGIKETYRRMEIDFDQYEFESINYLYGKDIVELGLEKKVFYKNDDHSVWVNNEDVGLDKKIVLRSDGTSIYITQDLGTAVKRSEKYNFEKLIYVVGSEQDYHFKTLFAILKKLGFGWADNCSHLSYGMVNLPEGKMKSREGNVIDADNLIDLLDQMAQTIVEEKNKELSADEKKDIAHKISLASLKYYLLNFSTNKDVMFIPEKSISFDGNTGPYLQYTTARINSLFLRNSGEVKINADFIGDYSLNNDEANLIFEMLEFEESVYKAGENLAPLELTTNLYNIARLYNKFYHDNPVLKAAENVKNFRLILSKAALILLKNGLNLLGIAALERM